MPIPKGYWKILSIKESSSSSCCVIWLVVSFILWEQENKLCSGNSVKTYNIPTTEIIESIINERAVWEVVILALSIEKHQGYPKLLYVYIYIYIYAWMTLFWKLLSRRATTFSIKKNWFFFFFSTRCFPFKIKGAFLF